MVSISMDMHLDAVSISMDLHCDVVCLEALYLCQTCYVYTSNDILDINLITLENSLHIGLKGIKRRGFISWYDDVDTTVWLLVSTILEITLPKHHDGHQLFFTKTELELLEMN